MVSTYRADRDFSASFSYEKPNLFVFAYRNLPIHLKINYKTWNTKPDKKYQLWFTITEVCINNIHIDDVSLYTPNPFTKYCRKD